MVGYFRKNLGFRLIALFVAIIVWFFVFSERNPITERVVSVPIEIVDLADDLVVADPLSSVNVRFQGKQNVVEKVTSRDFSARASLKDKDVGVAVADINVSIPTGVRFVSVQPSVIDVTIDQVASIQRPIEVVIEGTPARGYATAEARTTPSEVIIKGPHEVLQNVGRVYVVANINNSYVNFSKYLPVLVEDSDQRLILGRVEVLPGTVDVTIPIISDLPSRTVPIVINFEGKVATGKKIGRISVNPETIKIYGNYDDINEIGYLPLTINITGLDETTTFEVKPEIPANVETYHEESIEINVEVINES